MTINNATYVFLFGLLCATGATNSWADPRCDCAYNKIQGTCTAIIERKGDWVDITTPPINQCSSVVWEIDGNPQVSTVTDGRLSEPLIGVVANAKIDVRSCKICKDANYPNASSNGPNGTPLQQPGSTSTKSVFDGTWIGSDRNIFGFSHSLTYVLSVSGSSVSGSVDTGGPGGGFSQLRGTATATAVTVTADAPGSATLTLTLIDNDTLKYSWAFGGGTLKRSQ